MPPGLLAIGGEVVGIGLDDHRRIVRLMQAEGDAVPFGVFDGLFLRIEVQADLACLLYTSDAADE